MNAPSLTKTAKPLSIALASLLVLTLLSSTAAATQGISATYNLQASMSTNANRYYSFSGLKSYFINESKDASTSASGTVTVSWMTDGRSANGSLSITRASSFTIYLNQNIKPNSTGSNTETINITFSGTGSEQAFDLLGPLRGHPTGTNTTITINGQTYAAIYVSHKTSYSYKATATETFTKTGEGGRTLTVTVNKSVTRTISATEEFWFSKTSGILLKSAIQGSISTEVSATGNITGALGGSESFTMTASYTSTFSRYVTATSITGLSS